MQGLLQVSGGFAIAGLSDSLFPDIHLPPGVEIFSPVYQSNHEQHEQEGQTKLEPLRIRPLVELLAAVPAEWQLSDQQKFAVAVVGLAAGANCGSMIAEGGSNPKNFPAPGSASFVVQASQ